MAASPYLVQALQALSQPAQQPQSGLALPQMQKLAQQAQAWQAQNPGQSYMAHGLQSLGQNVMNAPGNAMNGLRNLVQGLPGMGPQTPPY